MSSLVLSSDSADDDEEEMDTSDIAIGIDAISSFCIIKNNKHYKNNQIIKYFDVYKNQKYFA